MLSINTLPAHRIEGTGLKVYTDGTGQGRILIFSHDDQQNDLIERVPGSNILIIGSKPTRDALKQLMKSHGRPTMAKLIPGGIAGNAYPALRAYLGITARADMQPHSQQSANAD